jgi:hypothetical protein
MIETQETGRRNRPPRKTGRRPRPQVARETRAEGQAEAELEAPAARTLADARAKAETRTAGVGEAAVEGCRVHQRLIAFRRLRMTLNFELVRGNERLECDFFVWSDTTELARAFGWKPRSLNPTRTSLSKLLNASNPTEVSDEDARSLAAAIRQCFWMLATNKRPTRRQIASLISSIHLTAGVSLKGDSILLFVQEPARIGVFLREPVRIAKFCCNGGFRMILKRQTAAPENRELSEATDEIS